MDKNQDIFDLQQFFADNPLYERAVRYMSGKLDVTVEQFMAKAEADYIVHLATQVLDGSDAEWQAEAKQRRLEEAAWVRLKQIGNGGHHAGDN